MAAAYPLPPPRAELRASSSLFQQVQAFLDSPHALSQTASDIELYAVEQGREIVRRQIEEHLALRASKEVRVPVVDQQGHPRPLVRHTKGQLLTLVGPCLLYTSPSPRD